MDVAELLADIGRACEELGYGITELKPGRVKLVARRGAAKADLNVVVTSVFLTGDLLRATLVRQPADE